jgi:hypothetical protein
MKHRFRNSIKDVQTMPGAILTDHNLLVATMCSRVTEEIQYRRLRNEVKTSCYVSPMNVTNSMEHSPS